MGVARGRIIVYVQHVYKPSKCPLCVFRFHCNSILNKNLCCYSLEFHYSLLIIIFIECHPCDGNIQDAVDTEVKNTKILLL